MTSSGGIRAAVAVLIASLATLALASVFWGQREGRSVAAAVVAKPSAAEPAKPGLPPSPAAQTPAADVVITPAVEVATPILVRVPSVDIRLPVVPKGVSPDGQMALPPKPNRVGWYRFGSAPDEPGSTVLAGHVDTRRFGIGPLARLAEVAAGDRVTVTLSDGRTIRYRTVRLRSIDKQSDALSSVFEQDGPRRLRLVTCGGDFDPRNGGYQENVVLTAVPLRG